MFEVSSAAAGRKHSPETLHEAAALPTEPPCCHILNVCSQYSLFPTKIYTNQTVT